MKLAFSFLHPRPGLDHLYNFHAHLKLTLLRNAHTGSNPIILPPRLSSLDTPEENALARTWIERFRASEIPKGSVQLSFSRSSGPGGQNVNKVNTKATLRCLIHENWIPQWAKPELKRSPYYVSSSQLIQITATVHRSQSLNIDECLSKFHALLVAASSAALKTEPSEVQKKRVEALVKAAHARRRTEKSYRSSVKARRKGPPE
ncbi:RF-1 domain-containing protein [Mycena maculata]|uniref:RF-1 domain-containing protein n=1 Tax=Mycena maculata TaxID=230809 RepID=A0AAD7NHG9_9AGAR|nr:RF-1 domain-containing protein [Mycena maculata]